jgi:hypothetical protein
MQFGGVLLCLVWFGIFCVGYTSRNGLDAVEDARRLSA